MGAPWLFGPDGLTNKELLPHAKAAALKAVTLDKNLVDAHLALASLYFNIEFDWENAEREYELALRLTPNDANTHLTYAGYLASMGRFDEALSEAKKADGLSPSSQADFRLGRIRYSMHSYDEAAESMRSSLRKEENLITHFYLGFVYVAQQKYDEAVAEFKRVADAGNNAGSKAALAYAYAMGSRKDEALGILDELKTNHKGTRIVPYRIAAVYLAFGDNDQAIEWLRKDYEVKDNWMNQLKVDPVMDPLRSDPRFQGLMHKMDFEEK